MANKTRITGGLAGFIKVSDAAYAARAKNHHVRYSHKLGFYLEAANSEPGDDVLWSGWSGYARINNEPPVWSLNYTDVRRTILENQEARS